MHIYIYMYIVYIISIYIIKLSFWHLITAIFCPQKFIVKKKTKMQRNKAYILEIQ